MKLINCLVMSLLLVGCNRSKSPSASHGDHEHDHEPLFGGTLVALGQEYHLEFVQDAAAGKMAAYVLDGHAEDFVRIAAASFTVSAQLPDREETLVFKAVAKPETGETVGNTAQFEAEAEWLKNTRSFGAVLQEIAIRGKEYRLVRFQYPAATETPAPEQENP